MRYKRVKKKKDLIAYFLSKYARKFNDIKFDFYDDHSNYENGWEPELEKRLNNLKELYLKNYGIDVDKYNLKKREKEQREFDLKRKRNRLDWESGKNKFMPMNNI